MVTILSELVGYKAGLALTREQMHGFVQGSGSCFFRGRDSTMLRVRSEEFEDLLCKLLYAVGSIRSPDHIPRFFRLYDEFKTKRRLFPIYLAVLDKWNENIQSVRRGASRGNREPIDVTPVIEWAVNEYGAPGIKVAMTLVEAMREDQHKSLLSPFRAVEWQDVAELSDLFRSEDISTPHGEFFDQRFVDFLSHNFQSIDLINWRKFEGLTCEHFHRLGMTVEIGKGRNDDGIDARIWSKGKGAKGSPLILVQCKRQQEKVSKIVVKALYSDVLHEKARLGLIVTSSALSPGAIRTCRARSYPVQEANRDSLKKWVMTMRTPYSGVFLGE